MNKLDLFQAPHLELKNVGRTYFRYDGKKYSVLEASPKDFDTWVCQYVETIENVDRTTWSIFHRWNIINAIFEEGLLCIVSLSDGDHLERMNVVPSEARSEEKASESASDNRNIKAGKPASEKEKRVNTIQEVQAYLKSEIQSRHMHNQQIPEIRIAKALARIAEKCQTVEEFVEKAQKMDVGGAPETVAIANEYREIVLEEIQGQK